MPDDDVPRDTEPTAPTTSADTRRTLDLSDWLTLEEAATAIGVSTRTVERLAKAGKLESRLRPQARGQAVMVYYPGDVAERAAERRPAPPGPFVVPVSANGNGAHGDTSLRVHTSPPITAEALLRDFLGGLVRAVGGLTPTAPTGPTLSERVSEPLFVTIREAAAITGLPMAEIKRAIADKILTARCGRVRRKDLETL